MNTATDPRAGWTSASNALADSLCPGRHLAQRGLPDPEKDEDAKSGTMIHAALANETPNSLVPLSLEQREMFDACRMIEKKAVGQFFGTKHPPIRVFRHERYWSRFNAPDGTRLAHSGEADVVFRAGTKVLIADYKTGNNEAPESPRNLQLRDLAVLVRGTYVTVDSLATVVVQPLVTHSPEVCEYLPADLDRAAPEMFTRVIASNDPNAKRIAGREQCNFCLAKAHCQEYSQWASAMTPPAMLSVAGIPMATWTPEQRGVAANALGPAQAYLDELKAFLKEGLAKDPDFVPGFTLQPGTKRSTIIKPGVVFERFSKLGGTVEQFMTCVAIVKSTLRERLHDVTAAKGMALDNAIEALQVDCVEVKESAPSLKKVSQ